MEFSLNPFASKKRNAERLAKDKIIDFLYKKAKAATYSNNNDYARIILDAIKNIGSTTFDYNLVKFINEGYVQNPHVYTVVNKVVKPCKNVPWNCYEVKDKKNFKRYKALQMEGKVDEAEVFLNKSLELVHDTPMTKMFEDSVNETQTWGTFIEEAIAYKRLTGNRYIYGLIPSGFNYPTKLYILPSQVIEIVPGDWKKPVKGYRMAFGLNKKEFEPETVYHSKDFNPKFDFNCDPGDYLYGMSPLQPLCRVVTRSNAAIDALLSLALNPIPPGMFTDATPEFGNPLQPEEVDELYKEWKKRNPSENYGTPTFSAQALKWTPIGMKAADRELLESDKLSLRDIAQVYNVPLQLIDDAAATHDNLKTAEVKCWEDARIPELISLREDFNKFVTEKYNEATGKTYWCDFDLKSVAALQVDKKEKSEIHLAERKQGIWTKNQYMNLMDYEIDPNDPNGDEYIMESGIQFIKDMVKPTNDGSNQA